MAHLIDVLVDRRIFFNVGIRGWDVGFWLIVVVVADKILHRIVRKEARKFAVELRCQRLVRGEDQGRLLHPRDHRGHGIRLARPGHPEEGLMLDATVEALDQCLDGLWLITCRLEIGDKGKSIHSTGLYSFAGQGSIGRLYVHGLARLGQQGRTTTGGSCRLPEYWRRML